MKKILKHIKKFCTENPELFAILLQILTKDKEIEVEKGQIVVKSKNSKPQKS